MAPGAALRLESDSQYTSGDSRVPAPRGRERVAPRSLAHWLSTFDLVTPDVFVHPSQPESFVRAFSRDAMDALRVHLVGHAGEIAFTPLVSDPQGISVLVAELFDTWATPRFENGLAAPVISPAIRALASRAVAERENYQSEDVLDWARRLAERTGHLDD